MSIIMLIGDNEHIKPWRHDYFYLGWCNYGFSRERDVQYMRALSILFSVLTLSLITFSSFANSLSDLTGSKPEFLPVEEAYHANLTIDPEALHVDWLLEPGYYLYKEKFSFVAQFDDTKRPLTATFEDGVQKYDEYFGKDLEVFYNATRVTLPTTDLPNQFTLKVTSQGCADAGLCYAPHSEYFHIDQEKRLATITEVAGQAPPSAGGDTAALAGGEPQSSFWLYLLMALLGGVILNLMPCVFPVLSLKALGLAASGGSKHRHHMHGWAYTLGVIGSFVVAALVIIVAKTAGEQSGWGF